MEASTIWIISPDSQTRRLIGLNLTKRGFQTLEMAPSQELPSSCERPQLVILDVEPPDESGWEVVRVLRQQPQTREVPLILLLSAAPTTGQLSACQPVHWVEKPLAIDALLALVRESLAPTDNRPS